MTSDWPLKRLGDIVELKRGYDLPEQSRVKGQYPIVSSSGITGSHSEAKVKGPGVVTGRYGTIGQVYYVKGDFWPLNTTLYVKDFKGNNPRFVNYLLKTINFQAYSDKAAVPGINRNHLHEAMVIHPPLGEQDSIARFLGLIDDEINLKQKINDTLEQTTRLLFESWFINFDPVWAKAEGKQPFGMDEETAALFPSEFIQSVIGKIPKGWSVRTLEDSIIAEKGLSYKGDFLSDSEGVPMHNLNSVHEGGGYKYEGIKHYTGEYKPRHELRAGDIIVTNTEQGFDYLLIGYPAIVPKKFGSSGIFTHHIFRVQPKPDSTLKTHFLYYILMAPLVREQIIACTNGTTVNMLNIDGLKSPRFILPPPELIERFERIAASIFEKVEANYDETVTLASLRETLLPKLLSGEIQIAPEGAGV